jgi:hypothetical protein
MRKARVGVTEIAKRLGIGRRSVYLILEDQPLQAQSATCAGPTEEATMAKGQKRSSREPKKPKAEKPKPAGGGSASISKETGGGSGTKK